MALVVAVSGISFAAPSIGNAQELIGRRTSWRLRDLFLPRRNDRVEPPAPVIDQGARKKKTKTARTSTAPVAPAAPIVEKLPDALVVLVIGDFLGSGLAEGLTAVYAENPRMRIVDRTSGSSGFVRSDFHNWPEKVVELIDAEKPSAVVIMLGANDRQQMRVGEVREQPRTENWNKEYAVRTASLAKAVSDKKVPFLWVGVPAFKSQKMLTDMLAFNDFYRTAAEGVSAEFIDIWDGFVDENGAFVTTGPDINGQPVRLRANDGINLTKPGKRKMAFYVEKPLNKLLGETGGTGAAAPAPAMSLQAVPPQIDIGSIVRTQPVSLRDPELDGGSELLGVVAAPKREAKSPGEKLVIDGVGPAAQPGRADDFSWPPAPPPTATAPVEKTGALDN